MVRRKILFISSWFPNRLFPFDGNFVQRHAEAVATLHDVEVLHAVPEENLPVNYQTEQKTVHGIKTVIVYYKDAGNPVINNFRKFTAYRKGYLLLQQPELVHANVLHTNLLFAVWLKKKFGIPFVVTEHYTEYRPANLHHLNLQQKWTARYIGNKAEAIFPVTRDLQKGLKELGIQCAMEVVPNVVDTEKFAPGTIATRPFTFLHISNLVQRKNPEKIVEAAIELMQKGVDIRLRIGGDADADDFAKISEMTSQSGFTDRFELFGTLNSEQVAEKMKTSDCFILFSEDENQPCVIAESFASGIPVLATDVGGIAEFFPENFGILLKERTVQNLVKAMQKALQPNLFADSEVIAEYASTNFSVSNIAERYSLWYDKILNEKFY